LLTTHPLLYLTPPPSHFSHPPSQCKYFFGIIFYTFCGDDGSGDLPTAGDGVRGKVSAIEVLSFAVTATKLLYLVDIKSSLATLCCIGMAVPTGIDELSGRYGATIDVGHDGGDGSGLYVDELMIPFASFSKLRKFSVSFDSIDNP
jgi:hypothetical protein